MARLVPRRFRGDTQPVDEFKLMPAPGVGSGVDFGSSPQLPPTARLRRNPPLAHELG